MSRGTREALLILALIAFPHSEWIQDIASAPGIEWTLVGEPVHVDAAPLAIAVLDALLIAAIIGRPLSRAHWLVPAVFATDVAAAAINGDRASIPGFAEDAGYWVVSVLYAAVSLSLLLLTVRVWIARQPRDAPRRPRWVLPFMAGTAVAYVADIVAYGTYCDPRACLEDVAFAKGAVPAVNGDFYETSAQIIAGLLIAIVVEGAYNAARHEHQDRVLRAATVALLAFASLFCVAAILAIGSEVGAAGDAREGVAQVPLAFVVTVQALVTGFGALLMAARQEPEAPATA